MTKPSNPQDTSRNSRVVGGHEVADDYADKYDARGGQFFGPPGDYGRAQGWKDGKPPQAQGQPQTDADPESDQLRSEHYKKFSDEFNSWRKARAEKLAEAKSKGDGDDGCEKRSS